MNIQKRIAGFVIAWGVICLIASLVNTPFNIVTVGTGIVLAIVMSKHIAEIIK